MLFEIFSIIKIALGISQAPIVKNIPPPSAAPQTISSQKVQQNFQAATEAANKKSTKKKSYIQNCPLQKDVIPDKGAITYGAEGQEANSRYFSRVLHVPSDSSGLTIGRGYDMKTKSENQILNDLTNAGVNKEDAEKISKAAKLSGTEAKNFIADNNLQTFCLQPDQQLKLFETTYNEHEKDAKARYERYNKADADMPEWDELDDETKTEIVDLRYRGDYTQSSNNYLKDSIKSGDKDSLRDAMSDKDQWSKVPQDRFDRRVNFLDE